MSEITLTAEIRKEVGKRSKTLRRLGKVPGIYYGHGQKNIPVTLTEFALKPLFKTSATHVINLKLDDGTTHPCILRAIQFDPMTDRPIHFDLFGLNADEKLTIEVPVILKGTPVGVKDGGTLQHVIHRLRVSCLPKYIPDHIELDVTELKINTSIHVKDLSVPNVRVLENESSTVAAVVPPTILKEAEPGTAVVAEAPAEPEVIARGKKPEEGEEATAPEPVKEKGKEEKVKEKGKEEKAKEKGKEKKE
ncbi:MAG TPA: 50S ribosomal protein L25 [Bacteroidota bacterium]|nr:50S ribosomal protein L25 [Bacteroidota bacterium]